MGWGHTTAGPPVFREAGEPDAVRPTGQYDAFIPLERGMVPVVMVMLRLRRAGPGQTARYGGGQVADGAQEKRGGLHTGLRVAGQR